MSLKFKVRSFLWAILGIDYNHILKVVEYHFLRNDPYTKFGYKSYSNNALIYRWSKSPVVIGKYCTIANGVRFIVDQGHHLTNCVSSYPFKNNPLGEKQGITIGNDVWIGQNVIIMPGVKIGNGVTIGAGTIVNKDVPDYCTIAGNPFRIVKEKCSKEDKLKMNEIAWWDWSEASISENSEDFQLSIPEFIEKYYK